MQEREASLGLCLGLERVENQYIPKWSEVSGGNHSPVKERPLQLIRWAPPGYVVPLHDAIHPSNIPSSELRSGTGSSLLKPTTDGLRSKADHVELSQCDKADADVVARRKRRCALSKRTVSRGRGVPSPPSPPMSTHDARVEKLS